MAGFPKFTPSWHNTSYPALSSSNPSVSAANKTVVITGGGRGVGTSIAASFAKAGASNIILLGRTASHLQSVKEDLEASFPKAKIHIFSADIADSKAIDTTFNTILTTIGPINILVNNAAYFPEPIPTTEIPIADWWRGFEVNVLGATILTCAFLRTAAPNPTLVNISTGLNVMPAVSGFGSYGASKTAFLRVLEFVALENPTLTVVSLHPGVIETEMEAKGRIKLPRDDRKSLLYFRDRT